MNDHLNVVKSVLKKIKDLQYESNTLKDKTISEQLDIHYWVISKYVEDMEKDINDINEVLHPNNKYQKSTKIDKNALKNAVIKFNWYAEDANQLYPELEHIKDSIVHAKNQQDLNDRISKLEEESNRREEELNRREEELKRREEELKKKEEETNKVVEKNKKVSTNIKKKKKKNNSVDTSIKNNSVYASIKANAIIFGPNN